MGIDVRGGMRRYLVGRDDGKWPFSGISKLDAGYYILLKTVLFGLSTATGGVLGVVAGKVYNHLTSSGGDDFKHLLTNTPSLEQVIQNPANLAPIALGLLGAMLLGPYITFRLFKNSFAPDWLM